MNHLINCLNKQTKSTTILQLNTLKRMASYLIQDAKYSFLKDLGLSEQNNGVFNGKWFANGQVTQSVCPANNKPIASVIQVSFLFNNKII